MPDRREFLKVSLAVAAGAAMNGTTSVFASQSILPKGLIYTKENPGKWAKKVKGHLPYVTIKGSQVTIETKHPMSEKHFIVRHTLITKDGEVIGEKTFYPSDKKAISFFEISRKNEEIYATSFCNKHDFWVARVKI